MLSKNFGTQKTFNKLVLEVNPAPNLAPSTPYTY